MMKRETKNKLLECIDFIMNMAQNMQVKDESPGNSGSWTWIEADARDLREQIEELEVDKNG